jgi:hypothetical protein
MATKKPGTAIQKWEEALAKAAIAAAKVEESTATANVYSLKAGVLSLGGNPIPGNKIAVIIADHVLENLYYEDTTYDADNPKSPTCFAFGRDEKTIGPHIKVVEFGSSQAGTSGLCAGCEHNEWGSAEKGKGKRCKNIRRLAVVQAGSFDSKGAFTTFDSEAIMEGSMGFLKLPVTSGKAYATYVKQLADQLKRPPFGVITLIGVVPDAKSQFKVTFEVLEEVDNNTMAAVFARHEEAKLAIEFPYALEDAEKEPPKKALSKASKPLANLPKRNAKKY